MVREVEGKGEGARQQRPCERITSDVQRRTPKQSLASTPGCRQLPKRFALVLASLMSAPSTRCASNNR